VRPSLVLLSAAVWCSAADAQTGITLGDVVVLRAGNGVATLNTNTAPVFLQEFTPAGSPVQTITVPSTAAGNRLTQTGLSNYSEGYLSLAGNGSSITFTGYDLPVGTANAVGTTANRVVGSVSVATGAVSFPATTTSLSGQIVVGAATQDGSRYWVSGFTSGTSGALLTQPTGGSGSATSVVATAAFCPRVVGGQLYYVDANSGIFRTNTPLPTGSSTSTMLAAYAGTNQIAAEFLLLDRSAAVPGVDTLYVAGNSGVQKFSFDGTTWTARGTIAGTFNGLAGRVSGTNAVLYATTGDASTANNSLQVLTDTTPFNSSIAGSFSTIASAGANEVFVGVALPVPEPTGAVLGVVGVAGLGWVRRRRAARGG
jgi:MYXO-CTERM domain-containing protein